VSNVTTSAAREARLARVRAAMVSAGVDALLLSLGADLPWLTGYEAMPLERLTMLVLPADDQAVLVVPELEAPRVEPDPNVFDLLPWSEGSDPVAIVADLVGGRPRLAIGDRTWATFVVALQATLGERTWDVASKVTGPIRAVKDEAEVEALAAASAAADRVAVQLLGGDIPLVGRSEADVSAEIGRRLIAEGHQRTNFAIVGSGPNSASPHHDAGPRIIEAGEAVVFDFGGTMNGYCSDTTRTIFTGEPSLEFAELYAILREAQDWAVKAAKVGVTCEHVDRTARQIIAEHGYGPAFIHRTGHGIGLEEHEDPYIVAGNTTPLVAGHAFSVEPGIYLAGRYGARIEDIVVATDAGPRALNRSSHELTMIG
jgi:Xaa-Pro aminopeptidase